MSKFLLFSICMVLFTDIELFPMCSDSPFPSLSYAARNNLLADNSPVGTAYCKLPVSSSVIRRIT